MTDVLHFLFLLLTDSVAYLSMPGKPDPPIGQHLGELTDQISDDYGPGSICYEFCAGGAKNYACKVAIGGRMDNVKVCIKVRGITINSSNDDIITFDNLKSMVLNGNKARTVPFPHQIARLPGWRIVTRDTSKKWQVCLNKRRRIDKTNTVPYGYRLHDDHEFDGLLEVLEQLANS